MLWHFRAFCFSCTLKMEIPIPNSFAILVSRLKCRLPAMSLTQRTNQLLTVDRKREHSKAISVYPYIVSRHTLFLRARAREESGLSNYENV